MPCDEPAVICAWCLAEIRAGGPAVSHGICDACAAGFTSQIDLVADDGRRRRRRFGGPPAIQALLPWTPGAPAPGDQPSASRPSPSR